MASIWALIGIGLVSGMAIGLQGPMASLINQKLGTLESVLIVHLGGVVIALVPLLLKGGGEISRWREVPWYALCAGFFGLIVITAMGIMIPRIGVTTTMLVVVAGQLIVGAVIDQFGLLGASVRPITITRSLGIAVMLIGVWLTVKE